MSTNRGKDFEALVKRYMNNVPNVMVERLYDSTNGFKNIKTPADFLVYKKPTLYYIECKSTDGGTIPFSRLTQLDELYSKKSIDGIRAGFLIWYKDLQRTYWCEADYVKEMKDCGARSINIKTLNATSDNRVILISASYPRVYGIYDFTEFFTK